MSYYSDLPPEKKKELLLRLEGKLKNEAPNKQSTAWFDFSWRNKGFEFMEVKTGRIKSKMEVFMKIYPDVNSLNLITINKIDAYIRTVKPGWVEVEKNGVNIAIRESDIPTYKTHEKH